jgi:hypothetical protein
MRRIKAFAFDVTYSHHTYAVPLLLWSLCIYSRAYIA